MRIVQDYVKEFNSLILDIINMFEEDKAANFMLGLQRWPQVELKGKWVKDLATTGAIIGGLINFR